MEQFLTGGVEVLAGVVERLVVVRVGAGIKLQLGHAGVVGDAAGAVQRGFVRVVLGIRHPRTGRRVQSTFVPQGIQSDGVNEVNLTLLQRMPPWEWPPSARDVLVRAVRNERLDAVARLMAARLAGKVVVMNDEVADILLAIVDRPISTRVFHRIREVLHASYRDDGVPEDVRRRILEASVRAPERWHRDAIHEAYSSDDRDWRLTAVFCMQYVLGFDDQIVEASREAILMAKGAVEHGLDEAFDEAFDEDTEPEELW